MDPGETFFVIDGPVCDGTRQLRWWKVQFGAVEGWSAEGVNPDRHLDSMNPPPEPGS
jgi:hypothetical protein